MKGVTGPLPPVGGRVYRGFEVHPPRPRFERDGSQRPTAIVIAHFDSDRRKYVVDFAMRDLTIAEAVIVELSREHPL
jgi:hypothetical protein